MKNLFKLSLLGFAGGILGAYSFIFISDKYFANISVPISEINTPGNVPTPAPLSDASQLLVSEASMDTAAVQVIQNDKLSRQGSGIFVSSDGLIATTADMGVAGAFYQIFHENKILKAYPVSLNNRLNLMLLKTDSPSPNVADLKKVDYFTGQDVFVIGKFVTLSKPVIFSQRGLISFVTEKNTAVDSTYAGNLSGSSTINSRGELIGINYLRSGRIFLINSSTIQEFVSGYLEKANTK